jgi:hypothetical protein
MTTVAQDSTTNCSTEHEDPVSSNGIAEVDPVGPEPSPLALEDDRKDEEDVGQDNGPLTLSDQAHTISVDEGQKGMVQKILEQEVAVAKKMAFLMAFVKDLNGIF